MAYSTQRVTSDGSLVLLSVSIGYLERDHIHVLFDNVEDDLPWAWVGPTSNQISFTPAVPNGVEVLVARVTDISAPYHVFSQGAQFTAESLDEDIEQILYISQEATEQASTGEYYQDINMHSFQVYNLGVTSDPTAAVSLGQYQADALGANVAKVAAQASQADALVSKNAAAASEAAADISEANAAASAAAALVSENAAELAETNAAASAAAAAASYDSFDDRYLGAKASEPILDNDGAALLLGALFWHNGIGLKAWNGAAWELAYQWSTNVVSQDSETGAADIPTGTTAQRPVTPEEGYIRRNSELGQWEGYDGAQWAGIGGASGGGGNPFCYENDISIVVDYTITTGKNAMSAGPVEVANSVTVTVPSGSVWSIV